jgi:hypothetical protein
MSIIAACASLGASGVGGYLAVRGWWQYQSFLERQRTAYLNAYTAADGKEVVQQVRISEMNTRDPRDVIALIAYVYLTGKTSIGELRGPLMLGGRSLRRIGELTDHGAEQAAKQLEKLGVLLPASRQGAGRKLRNDTDLSELILSALDKWQQE